ncbi:hypothetical protein BX600DRAFT_70393 [Xylariales sp. PMI_506]|nr:hypothetical protein BX600DRAFT_70393 [Xylariales sp. PMI_506]
MRRTALSVQIFGRLDEVDALGYLDAIEKVRTDTVVIAFVSGHECSISLAVESAMTSLISTHLALHFVKVYHDDIEFNSATSPAILAYRNRGDLFANITGMAKMVSKDGTVSSDLLGKLFEKLGII